MKKRLTALVLVLCLLLTVVPAQAEGVTTPTDVESPAPTEAPTEEPTAEPTEMPTEEPTAEPTEAPTEAPTAEPTEEPTAEPVAEPTEVPSRIEIDLTAAGGAALTENTTYILTGGDIDATDVTVAAGVTAKVRLNRASIRTLTLGENSRVTIESSSRNNELQTLAVGAHTDITWIGTGSIAVERVTLPEEGKDCGEIRVQSGSVNATFPEAEGREKHTFAMSGATSITVDGAEYTAGADRNGQVYLWLPQPQSGATWQATVTEGVLCVAQVASATAEPTVEATEEPTAEPTEEPTEEPTAEPTVEPTEEPVAEPTAEPTTDPKAEPTAEATAEPTVEATEEPTAEPTEEPTEEPTAEPTVEPTAEPTAEPTTEPWDESQCDHLTLDCEQAPECTIPGCEHIGEDVHGLLVPLCDAGAWLLNQIESAGIMTYSVREIPIDLSVADAVIWRSGSYTVLNGKDRAASLTVKAGRTVVLNLTDAAAASLTLEAGSYVILSTEGQNEIAQLSGGEGTVVTLTGAGHLTVGSVSGAAMTVESGSVQGIFTEANGLTCHAFAGEGSAAVTVNGDAYPAAPDGDGVYHLWLPAPADGMTYAAQAQDNTLQVTLTAVLSPDEPLAVAPQGETEAEAGCTYLMQGDMTGASIHIAVEDVTVILSGVTGGTGLLNAEVPYTLVVRTESMVADAANARIIAEEPLTILGNTDGAIFVSGRVVLGTVPAGYRSYEVESAVSSASLILNGEEAPLLLTTGHALLLPVLEKGQLYRMTAEGDFLAVETLNNAYDLAQWEKLDVTGMTDVLLTGEGGCRVTVASGNAICTLDELRLMSTIALTDATLTAALTGDNTLGTKDVDALTLSGASAAALTAMAGRTTLYQGNLTGLTLQGNIRVLPENGIRPEEWCLTLTDENGLPAADRDVNVSIGGERYDFTTFPDGTLHLWGMGDLTGTDVAVTDGETVYTAVITGGQTEVNTGLSIENVQYADQADGSVLITFTCEGAASSGVQLRTDGADTPDAFDGAAQRIPAENGQVRVTGLTPGQIYTFRVYASASAGAELTADTDDGFQFSEQAGGLHRIPYPTDQTEAATVAYTGKSYVNPLTIPAEAAVTYTGRHLNWEDKPLSVGDYTMRITIPENSTTYLPGVYEIPFAIERIKLHIIPEPNMEKYMGEADPEEFPYTVDESKLLKGDTVTGLLTRVEGEEVGNYRFLTSGLKAEKYYELIIYESDPVFTILPSNMNWGFYEIYRPVVQEIVKANGRKVSVKLNTGDTLMVTGMEYGQAVRSTEDNTARNFSPSLVWNEEKDEVLLRVRTEPELNRDKGYATNPDGTLMWTGRSLRLNYSYLRMMNGRGVDALSLYCKDAALMVTMEDLFSDAVIQVIDDHKYSRNTATICLEIIPVDEVPVDIEVLRPVTDGWTVRVNMLLGKDKVDITGLLPSLTAMVDMEPVAELLTTLDIYDEEAFADSFTLAAQRENGEMMDVNPVFVAPFMPEEMELAPYATMMYADRYLMVPMTENMTIWCVRAPESEETAAETEAAK